MIAPFRIEIDQAASADLRGRLAGARWPDEIPGVGWEQGTDFGYLKELVDYWRSNYDWPAHVERLNRLPHYLATVDGTTIHFIHCPGTGPRPMPLILTHGWPSTFFEMTKIIPLLADPASHGDQALDAFDVVVPSLPGYGFSPPPRHTGMTKSRIARLWARLMTDVLGYDQFAAHGGDIGAGVTTQLGLEHAAQLIGIHVTAVTRPYLGPGSPPLTEEERAYDRLVNQWYDDEGAYSHQQRTRPQTLAYGLNDSPIGLAAWIIEKYRAWSDCDGDVERRFTKDELLTNVMIYWVTQTIGSSIRIYYDHARYQAPLGPGERIAVPTGVCLTREALDRAPRTWAERSYNLHRWSELPSGGHFAALEEPRLLAEDIRAFFRPLRG